MKRILTVFCGVMLVTSAAQGAGKDGFWNRILNRLEKVTPAKKTATTTAVGGVRGAKNDDATDIYWKGKDKDKPIEVPEEELQKFNSGIEAKLKGDNEAALKQFEEFLVAFPNSSLRLDGLQAAERIRSEIAAAKSPVQAAPVAVSMPANPVEAPAPAAKPEAVSEPAPLAAPPKPAAPLDQTPVPAPAPAPQPVAEGDSPPLK